MIFSEDYTDGCIGIVPMNRLFNVPGPTILESAAVQIRTSSVNA
jgi:hypothetical protein